MHRNLDIGRGQPLACGGFRDTELLDPDRAHCSGLLVRKSRQLRVDVQPGLYRFPEITLVGKLTDIIEPDVLSASTELVNHLVARNGIDPRREWLSRIVGVAAFVYSNERHLHQIVNIGIG